MTDHSILNHSLPKLPFEEEAHLITRVLNFFSAIGPSAINSAIDAQHITENLVQLSDAQLAELGIARTDIAAYAAKNSGLLDR